MKTIDQTIADIEAKAANEIARARKTVAIVECLKTAPRFVHVYPLYGSIGSVSYQAKSKREAYGLLQQFDLLPAYLIKDNSGTGVRAVDTEDCKSSTELYAWLDISQHGAKLHAYAQINAGVIRVDVDLPLSLFGTYRKSDPRARTRFTMEWQPTPETNCIYCAVNYSRVDPQGAQSGRQQLYAIYDAEELRTYLGEVQQ